MNKSVFSDDFDSLIGYTLPQRQQPQPTRASYAPAGLTTPAPATSGSGSGMGGGSVFSDDFDALIGYGSSQPAPGGYQPPSYTPPSYSGGWDPYTLEDEQAKLEEEERKRRNPYGVIRNKLGQAAQGVADVIGQGLKGASVRGAMDWMAGLDTVPTVGGVAQSQVQPGVIRERQAQPMDPTAGPLWKAGGEVQGRVAKALPVNEDATFWDEVARGAGSTVGFGLGGLLTGGNPLGVAMSGAMVGMGSGYEEAKQHGADDTEAQLAGALSGLVGVSEVAPVGKWVGKLTRVIPQGKILNRIKEAGIEGLEESLQEAFQSTAGNAIAREIYDEDRELFEGVARSGAVGGVSGLLMGAVVNALPGRQRGAGTQPTTRQEQAAAQDPMAPQATEQTQQQQTLDALNAQLRAGQAPLPQGTEIIQGAPQEIRPPKAAAKAAPGADIFSSLIPSDEIEKLERFKQEQQAQADKVAARQAHAKLKAVGIPEDVLGRMSSERKLELAQMKQGQIMADYAGMMRTLKQTEAERQAEKDAAERALPVWKKTAEVWMSHNDVDMSNPEAVANARKVYELAVETAAKRGEMAPEEVVDPQLKRKVSKVVKEVETQAKAQEVEAKWENFDKLSEAEQNALVAEYERGLMEDAGDIQKPDYASSDELQNRISRTGKLMHPDNLRDANDPLAGEVRAIYNALNVGQRRKLFAGKSEGGLTLDAMRESLSEGGSGFDYSTPDDLLQAMDESIMRGRPQMANYAARPDDVRFSAADPAANDAEYMKAVESGDTETAQRLVDERAKRAGYYGQRKFYHGTPDGRFNTFEKGRGIFSDSRDSFVFTDSKQVADEFRGGVWANQNGEVIKQYPNTSEIKTVYLDLKNVDQWDYYGGGYQEGKVLQAIKEAKKAGKKGVIFRNMRDGSVTTTGRWPMSNVVFVFDPEQIKSADPITRDDDGKVIPLSRRFDSGSPDIRYSAGQGTRQQVGRPGDAIDQAVADLTAKWKQGRVEVKDLRDLPAGDLREMREKGMLRSAGYFNTRTGRITLIRNNLTDPAHAVRVALHEAVGHYGVRAVLGDQFDSTMQMVADAYRGKELWKRTLARWKLDPATRPGDAIIAAEEIVAQMAEGKIDNPGLWTRITAAIRRALGMISSQEWTDIQIRRLLTQSRRYLEGRREAARSTRPAVSPTQATQTPTQTTNLSGPDADYMAAVERGDMQTAQRLVDEAAEKAGYKTKAWHGTLPKFKDGQIRNGELPFTRFEFGRNASGAGAGIAKPGFWFTDSRALARNFAIHALERQGIGVWEDQDLAVLPVYLKLTDPEIIGGPLDKVSSERLTARARETTKDSLIARNADEPYMGAGNETVYMIKDPAHVKVALPITRDDSGRIIPPSERFKDSSPDIRYNGADQDILALQHIDLKTLTDDQLYERGDVLFEQWEQAKGTEKARLKRLYNKLEQEQRDRRVAAFINKPPPPVDFAQLDAEYMAAVESGDMAQMIRILDKVAKEKGYTIKGFHGTPDGRFIDESHRFGGRYASIAPGYQEVFWFAKSPATAASYADDRRATDYQNAEPRTWQGYLKITNPLEVFAHGRPWRDAQLRGKTGYVIDEAREKGNDGIIIYDVKDNYNNTAKTQTTDTYSVFKPEQIKSAEPITRDDSGRIIPPSERFKDSSPDIRFSAPEPIGFHMYPMEVDVGKFSDAQLQERLEMLTNLIEERQAENQPTHALYGLRSEVRAEIADRKLAAEQEGDGDPEEIQEPTRQDAPPVKPNPKRLRQLEAEILEARTANKTVAEAVILERNQLKAAEIGAADLESVVAQARLQEDETESAEVKNLMLKGATYQERSRWERIKEWFAEFWEGWDQLPGIKNDDTRFTFFRDAVNDLRGAKERISQEASEIIRHILEPIDKLGANTINKDAIVKYRRLRNAVAKRPSRAGIDQLREIEREMMRSPYALFQNLLLYKDMLVRGNMISPITGEPVLLPRGLSAADVEAELSRLVGMLVDHPHRAEIEEAMRRHYKAMADEKGLLEKYGYLIPADQSNPYYYPHLVIDYMSGKMKNARVMEDKPFRGYMEELTGSNLDIETDYLNAVFSHLYAVRIHNAQADFVKNGIEAADKTADIVEDLQRKEDMRAAAKGKKPRKIQKDEAYEARNIPEGYVLHTVDERLPFRPVDVIDRGALGKALGVTIHESVDLQQFIKQTGADVRLTAQMIEGALALGKRRKMVIPVEMNRALKKFIQDETKTSGAIMRALGWVNTVWKKQKLYFPTNWIRYEYGNLSTDIIDKVLIGDPGVIRKLPQAWREVREFWKEGKAPTPELAQAYRNRVLESVTAREVGELTDTSIRWFDNFATSGERQRRKLMDAGKSAMSLGAPQLTTWGVARNQTEASSIREGIFRYAKYLASLERLQRGADPIYQGARKADVEATVDSYEGAGDAIYRKAAKIARRTFVDYGEMSANGEVLRKAWIPFWSWMEGNFKYHRALCRNLRDLQKAGEISALRGHTVATINASRIAAGVILRYALTHGAIHIWNNVIAPLVFGGPDDDDLEKYMGTVDRRRMHIITGFDPETKEVRLMYTPNALSDVMEWFSGNQLVGSLIDGMTGRVPMAQAAQEWAASVGPNFLNKIVQSVAPTIKVPYTFGARKRIFPDVLDQRSIPTHDLQWAILEQMVDQFTAEQIRRVLDPDFVQPRELKDWAQQLILQQRTRSPESWAYYSIRDKAADYAREKYGSDVEFGANNSKSARAVSGFRKAIYYGDPQAAMHWYLQLLDFGYTKEQFQGSIRGQNPLNAVKVGDRAAFLKTLTPYEREQVQLAMQHYAKIRSFKGRELDLFPRKAGGDREADYYRKKADSRSKTMQSIIRAQDRMSPEALRRTGESLIREEEYRW